MQFTDFDIQYLAALEASRRDMALCSDKTVMAVITSVTTGRSYVGFNFVGHPMPVCPRVGMARGKGYSFCKAACNGGVHAEIDALKQFDFAEPVGTQARMVVFGANHICDACHAVLAKRPEIEWSLFEVA